MKQLIALLAVCLLAAGVYFLLRGPSSTENHAEAVAADPAPNRVPVTPKNHGGEFKRTALISTGTETQPTGLASVVEKSATPYVLGSENNPPSMESEVVLRNVRNAVHQYNSMFGGNPTGNNPEITAALNGGNSKEARFITEESGLRINGRGELVDSWGTPFFFHQLGANEMEIRSAGPDKKIWTRDDLVTK